MCSRPVSTEMSQPHSGSAGTRFRAEDGYREHGVNCMVISKLCDKREDKCCLIGHLGVRNNPWLPYWAVTVSHKHTHTHTHTHISGWSCRQLSSQESRGVGPSFQKHSAMLVSAVVGSGSLTYFIVQTNTVQELGAGSPTCFLLVSVCGVLVQIGVPGRCILSRAHRRMLHVHVSP